MLAACGGVGFGGCEFGCIVEIVRGTVAVVVASVVCRGALALLALAGRAMAPVPTRVVVVAACFDSSLAVMTW